MLLKDQYPISTDKEITIELLDNGKAKVNPETGILTLGFETWSRRNQEIQNQL